MVTDEIYSGALNLHPINLLYAETYRATLSTSNSVIQSFGFSGFLSQNQQKHSGSGRINNNI